MPLGFIIDWASKLIVDWISITLSAAAWNQRRYEFIAQDLTQLISRRMTLLLPNTISDFFRRNSIQIWRYFLHGEGYQFAEILRVKHCVIWTITHIVFADIWRWMDMYFIFTVIVNHLSLKSSFSLKWPHSLLQWPSSIITYVVFHRWSDLLSLVWNIELNDYESYWRYI